MACREALRTGDEQVIHEAKLAYKSSMRMGLIYCIRVNLSIPLVGVQQSLPRISLWARSKCQIEIGL
eukprot:6177441-Pleurochrysis_carterae.AAC.1